MFTKKKENILVVAREDLEFEPNAVFEQEIEKSVVRSLSMITTIRELAEDFKLIWATCDSFISPPKR